MKIRFRISFIIGSLLFGAYAVCQDPFIPTILPPSPDASSLGKYGEFPVGKYSGTVDVSIPLYTINAGNIKLPVALSYHTGGIKVEELSGWVGLGWALNAGGAITVSVVGIPDFVPTRGWLNHSYNLDDFPSVLTDAQQKAMMQLVEQNSLDTDPDVYSYNVNGLSGKFIIDKATMTTKTVPESDVNVLLPQQSVSGSWEIIDAGGNRYVFAESESLNSDDGKSHQNSYSSTYLLTLIKTPTNEEITFSYQSYYNLYYSRYFSSKDYPNINPELGLDVVGGCLSGYAERYGTSEIMGKRIESVVWSSGSLKFKKGLVSREDLPGDYFLEYVEVYNKNVELQRKFKLEYGYFSGSNAGISSNFLTLMPNKRLKLLSVRQVGQDGSLLQPYSFFYNPELPYYFSKAQDIWGFYNGISTNATLLPKISDVLGDADRTANANSDRASLQKITYPTGGSTEFQYECNEALLPIAWYKKKPIDTYQQNPIPIFALGEGQDGGLTTANIGVGQNSATFTVDPAIGDELSRGFSYVVNFPTAINCPGTDKTCVGNLEIQINASDGSHDVDLLGMLNIVNGSASGVVNLRPGKTYTLSKFGSGVSPNITVGLTGKKNPVTYMVNGEPHINIKVGGLRIKKIINTDNTNIQTQKTFRYHNNVASSTSLLQASGGRLSSIPIFGYANLVIGPAGYECSKFTMSANSMAPMATNGGSQVGYKYVQEIDVSSSEELKTLTEYVSTDEFLDFYDYTYPYVNTQARDYLRGYVLKESKFKFTGTAFIPLSEEINTYDYTNPVTTTSLGVVGACPYSYYDQTTSYRECLNTLFKSYQHTTRWFFKKKTETRIYDNPTTYLSNVTDYYYDNLQFKQLSKTETYTSKNELFKTEYKYPFDFQNPSSPNVYDEMVARRIINPVVETVNYNGTTFLQSQKKSFSLWGSMILPLSIEQKVTSFPAELKVNFLSYDSKGNILSYEKVNDVKESYIWGYDQTSPIARVVNAPVKDIFYTSFEEGDGNSVVNDSRMGKYSRLSGFQKSLSNLTNGDYCLSYWIKSSGSWALQKTYVTVSAGSYQINLSGQVDEVRFYPRGARMSTINYEPLKGVISEADINDQLAYYEYDAFGRLSMIKDQDGNILKKLCYNLSGQPEVCSFGTAPDWRNTSTAVRCRTIDGANTGEQEQEQQDMNPYSPSTGSTRWIVISQNCSVCPKNTIAWMATGISRCQLDGSGNYTGYREMKYRNMEPCSPTYLAEMWAVYTQDVNSCPPPPPPCSETNCTGNDKKCINGICETGVWTCVSSTRISQSVWRVTYRYKFSDGSYSTYYQEIDQSGGCFEIEP